MNNRSQEILNAMAFNLPRVQDAGATERALVPKSLGERGGFYERLINLADPQLTTGAFLIDMPVNAYGLAFATRGSTPGASFQLVFNSNIKDPITNFRPGEKFKGPFDRITISLSADSVPQGTARLIFFTANDVDYIEQIESGPSAYSSAASGPNGASTQAQNTASRGANKPVAATDGISLEGRSGVKCTVKANGVGSTITGGQIRLWYFDPELEAWGRTTAFEVLDTGGQLAPSSDYNFDVLAGRVYFECDLVTTSDGSSLTVQLTGM